MVAAFAEPATQLTVQPGFGPGMSCCGLRRPTFPCELGIRRARSDVLPIDRCCERLGGAAAGGMVVVGAAGSALAGMTATNNLPGLLVAVSMFLFSGAVMAGVIHALQRALVRLRASEEQAEVMAREMRHRVANVLQLVQSIAQLSLRTSTDPSTVLPLFESRLIALSKSHRISSGGAGGRAE